jgi:hypothetical protein
VPVTIPVRRTAYIFPRLGNIDLLLAVWAITVLLIAAYASFGGHAPFPGDFDVSVASF